LRALRVGLAGLLLGLAAVAGHAGVLRYCDASPDLDAAQRDTLLRVAAVVRQELQRSDTRVALVSRSGLDLSRLGVRYSHAGIGLADSPAVPWSVRQLYFDCDEGRARLFDQGLAGFVLGQHDARLGFVSLVLLPGRAAESLARAALDERQALALLGPRYSANAYAQSTRYQNCNQWVAELMATAWGGWSPQAPLQGGSEGAPSHDTARGRAQHWLREAGYQPSRLTLPSRTALLAVPFVPWVHLDDHPEALLQQRVMEVSMPEALEAFIRAREPDARRIEVCYSARRIVVRRGWAPLSSACEAETGDESTDLD
jgi:hypothetical protein